MKQARWIIAAMLFVFAVGAAAFQPRTGHWYDSTAPGRGFNFDIQNGILVMTVYTYDSAGNAQWYLSAGPMTNAQHSYTGTLDKYVNGQCIVCSYRPAQQVGNDGAVFLNFSNETTATITFPGGLTSVIHPFDFGYGDPPNGLKGEWIFVYDIIQGSTTFAERFDLTTVSTPSSNGTGIVLDVPRSAGCEYQLRGNFAGEILCVDLSSTGAIQNSYAFRYGGGDETFSGVWIAPTTFNQYSMKGFRVVSPAGYSKAAKVDRDDIAASLKAAQDGAAMSPLGKAPPELIATLQSLATRLLK